MFRPNWPSSGVRMVVDKDSFIGHYMSRLTGHLQLHKLLWLRIPLLVTICFGLTGLFSGISCCG
jgi:hypothetical protein